MNEANETSKFLSIISPSIINSSYDIIEIPLLIDYSRNLDEMIAAGKYDFVFSNIYKDNFSVPYKNEKEEISTKFFSFDQVISSENILKKRMTIYKRMSDSGFRPATLLELLAMGEFHPELQEKFPILATGTSCQVIDKLGIPCLTVSKSGRGLALRLLEDDWKTDCRILGVRT